MISDDVKLSHFGATYQAGPTGKEPVLAGESWDACGNSGLFLPKSTSVALPGARPQSCIYFTYASRGYLLSLCTQEVRGCLLTGSTVYSRWSCMSLPPHSISLASPQSLEGGSGEITYASERWWADQDLFLLQGLHTPGISQLSLPLQVSYGKVISLHQGEVCCFTYPFLAIRGMLWAISQ